ncbi:hypothetical protein NM208_g1191 [Fusarium decemcellulare]|uniref:Uncharacterized protein n=1 Tax=Fusarium decemcellulare TaxID=57161 RepID=A0ACC1SWY6_9HYPO|nr:hypothetical protein NM208_g1191 [Fusarium decemcellulare]
MWPFNQESPDNAASSIAWESLVRRSLEAWHHPDQDLLIMAKKALQRSASLDDFLAGGSKPAIFWFFQRREAFLSQARMRKWSRHRLDDYVLLPATDGFVKRTQCFFVSHFWQTREHPDPEGEYLRLHQRELGIQDWSYIWTDWTCMPQEPRLNMEEVYFRETLQTMSGIIRNSGFAWFYPPFEARLWILYEVAEYVLSCTEGLLWTPDNENFIRHVNEMFHVGVRSTLDRHGYRCTYERDREFLTSWLEVLVLLRSLKVDIDDVRMLLDNLTWQPMAKNIMRFTANGECVQLLRFEGKLILDGEHHEFTPFPQWADGKYSTNHAPKPTARLNITLGIGALVAVALSIIFYIFSG